MPHADDTFRLRILRCMTCVCASFVYCDSAQFWRFCVSFASFPLRVIRNGIIDGMSIANAHFHINRRDICCCWCCCVVCLCACCYSRRCTLQLLRGFLCRRDLLARRFRREHGDSLLSAVSVCHPHAAPLRVISLMIFVTACHSADGTFPFPPA